MIIPQEIEVAINSTTKKYWEEKGYYGKCGDYISVKEEELPPNSHAIVKRKCDCCGEVYENTFQKISRSYNAFKADYCQTCVKNDLMIQRKKQIKTIQTSQNKYGTDSPNQSNKVKRNKEQASILKYGVSYPTQLEEVKIKTVNTYLQKYGVTHPAKTSEFHEKIHNTMLQNGTAPTSKPQIEIYEILQEAIPNAKVEINKPLSKLMLDISIIYDEGDKINVEYDGWYWHRDARKDFRRDKYVQSNGYKILRIKSGSLVPSKEQLLEALEELISNDKNYSHIILPDWKNL